MDTFNIGKATIEIHNSKQLNGHVYTNERYIEVALIQWFYDRFDGDIIEIGCVSPHHINGLEHIIHDKFEKYGNTILVDMLTADYNGKNVISISTIEHVWEESGKRGDRPQDNGPIVALNKIMNEAQNYLITFPLGWNDNLDAYTIDNHRANMIVLSWPTKFDMNKGLDISHWTYEGHFIDRANKEKRFLLVVTNIDDLLNA